MARLSALAADSMEGRRAGSPGGARARRWIIQELQAIGVEPIDGRYDMPVRLRGRAAGADTLGANIVARIPGRRREGPVLVLSAHYDHLGVRNGVVYNGADDDASGCVALLAIAERLRAEPPEHDVLLAFFDAEESGLVGARAFVAAPPVPIERVAANLNLDMVARQDGGALWVAGTAHYPQLRPAAEAAAANARIKIRFGHDTPSTKPGDDWTNSSDHGPFHAQRIPFLYLGVEDHADYHQPGDKAAKVDPTFYSAVVDFAHALTRQLDQRLAQFKR
jgi:Zn-dependent M28 family amino/carboxypeptidase